MSFILFLNLALLLVMGRISAVFSTPAPENSAGKVPIEVEGLQFSSNVSANVVFPLRFRFLDTPAKEVVVVMEINQLAIVINSAPVLFLVQHENYFFSDELPRTSVFDNTTHYKASWTLCSGNDRKKVGSSSSKLNLRGSLSTAVENSLLVVVSTLSVEPVHFTVKILNSSTLFASTLTAEGLKFDLQFADPSSYEITVDDFSVDAAHLKLTSEDGICITVSVQDAVCPLLEQEHNVHLRGTWQTMTKQSGFTLKKSEFPHGLRIVLVMHGNSLPCARKNIEHTIPRGVSPNIGYESFWYPQTIPKMVHVELREVMLEPRLYMGVFIPLLIYGTVLGVSIAVSSGLMNRLYSCICPPQNENRTVSAQQAEAEPAPNPADADSIQFNRPQTSTVEDARQTASEGTPLMSPATGTGIINSSPRMNLKRRPKFISDYCNITQKTYVQNSKQYLMMLGCCFLFYITPVVQMVYIYYKKVDDTGNMDLCYYNFLCSHPFLFIQDFNHIYSNIGYIFLGWTFIVIVYFRQKHQKALEKRDPSQQEKGIPNHFGFYYAMGCALAMEGVLSSCYHICPNQSSLQFDTLFMHITVLMGMFKLYEARHPDANVKAYIVFTALPLLESLVPVFLYVERIDTLYIILTIAHILLFGVALYYLQMLDIEWRNIWPITRTDSPRVIFITLLIIANLWLAISAAIHKPIDVAGHFFVVLGANVGIYFMFYVAMKFLNYEKVGWKPIVCTLVSVVFAALSMYFFLICCTAWLSSPAESRNWNRDCILFGFYDNHDLWHFLSSFAVFFLFLTLLTLDDDRSATPRKLIMIF